MALYLPVRAFNKSQGIRIGKKTVKPTDTTYVDISDGKTRRDLANHSAIGAVFPVGPLTASSSTWVVPNGVNTDEGASNSDLIVRTYAGVLRNRDTGVNVDIAQTDSTLSAADGTNPRNDIIQVNTTTGAVTKKNGTAAATPAIPSADAGNIAVAVVNVPASDTAITNNQITDVRPRP